MAHNVINKISGLTLAGLMISSQSTLLPSMMTDSGASSMRTPRRRLLPHWTMLTPAAHVKHVEVIAMTAVAVYVVIVLVVVVKKKRG